MKFIFLIMIMCSVLSTFSQSNFDNLLQHIKENNLSIRANQKNIEAKAIGNNINRFLNNPSVEYDHLFGNPVTAGTQRDFAISQQFDFPTVYKRKKKLYEKQVVQYNTDHLALSQEILLDAKLLLLEMVWLNKRKLAIGQRIGQFNILISNYQKKLNVGEATILELNKARVQLYKIRLDSIQNVHQVNSLQAKLFEINGGKDLTCNDTLYPHLSKVPEFLVLDSMIESNDIKNRSFKDEMEVLQQNITLQKAMNHPKFEIGYHSQSILNQSYKGIHIGFTIPISENKNKVKAARSYLEYHVSSFKKHQLEHSAENKQLYELLLVQENSMKEYLQVIKELNTDKLLNKALRLGQVSINEFIEENDLLFDLYDNYLETELVYYQTYARLYRFQL